MDLQTVKQYVKPSTSHLDRGSIFFGTKDGTHPAGATLVTTYSVYMSPKLIKDAPGTYQALSHYLKYDEAQFLKKAALVNDPYEELTRKAESSVAQSVIERVLVMEPP